MVDVKSIVNSILVRAKAQTDYMDYYEGRQPLTYTSKKYRSVFADMVSQYIENMCPAVVDPITDRLKVLGLEIEGSDSNDAATTLWGIWRDNRMERNSNDVHQKALITGNSYVMVWPDNDGNPVITPQYADNFTVRYSEETGLVEWAAKCWQQDDGFVRLTIYYPDRTEKYISDKAATAVTNWDGLTYLQMGLLVNPYKRVPVFHFANNAPKTIFGVSELKDVMPLQNALNKSIADLLVTMEFSAYGQRWVTGLELEENENGTVKPPFVLGQDRVIAVSNENANFGEFSAAELTQFVSVHDMFVMNIARVSGTPLHYMLINSSVFPSGEALKTAEQRFVSKVNNRQLTFGETWEDVLKFCAEIKKVNLTDRIDIKWSLSAPRSEREFAEIAQLKASFGVSNEQLQREAGYTEAQIAQMKKEREAAIPPALKQPVNNSDTLREAE